MSAVRFDHVSKAYDLHSGTRSIFASVKMIAGRETAGSRFYALSDVSFDIKQGEAFGIIGRNGAGKSTVLKLIAGITRPTLGSVEVSGLISSLIELGAGFHPDLTGRENVYMSAAILGLSRKYIDGKFDEIVDFAELWDFIDVPVKKYSSGMYARLGFSVAVSVKPEILIIDEILSVGDVFFQQKCFARMRQIIGQGTTFIYVSHDTAAMQNLCERAALLDGGKLEFIGATTEAVSRYYAKMGQKPGKVVTKESVERSSRTGDVRISAKEISEHSILKNGGTRHGARGLEVVAARVTNWCGVDTMNVEMQGQLTIALLLRANDDVVDPSCGIHLFNRMGTLVFAAGTRQLRHRLPDLLAGEQIIVNLDLTLNVVPGEYTFSLGASEPSADDKPNVGYVHDRHEMLGPITVTGDDSKVFPFYGIAKLPMNITCQVPNKI
jgi:ABC-type polysaccharide/polyol phosphate transport system ATPase subunit